MKCFSLVAMEVLKNVVYSSARLEMSSIFLVVIAVFFITVILKQFTALFDTKKLKSHSKAPPLPSTIPMFQPVYPIIGNYVHGIPYSKVLKYAEKRMKTQESIFRFKILQTKGIVINSAPHLDTLLKSGDYGHIRKNYHFRDLLSPFMENGVGQSDGDYWKTHRKILMRSQKYSALKQKMTTLCVYTSRLCEMLEERFITDKPQAISDLLGITILGIITGMFCKSWICEMKAIYRDNTKNLF